VNYVASLRIPVGETSAASTGRTSDAGTAGVSHDEPRVGTLFAARYEIQSVVGKGGVGVVYKALDHRLEDLVAIKTLHHRALSTDPWLLDRFKQEIRLARRITHPNVLRTHDLGEWNGLKFLSMEFVQGLTLEQVVATKESLPTPVGLGIAKQICRGLSATHEVGIVHGDIKPQNIMVEPTGSTKIMDFGSAHLADGRERTTPGRVMGTLGYMSPEQARGLPLDFRSDIYSLGRRALRDLHGLIALRRRQPGRRGLEARQQHAASSPVEESADRFEDRRHRHEVHRERTRRTFSERPRAVSSARARNGGIRGPFRPARGRRVSARQQASSRRSAPLGLSRSHAFDGR
jgi:serine/threonine protein kinase